MDSLHDMVEQTLGAYEMGAFPMAENGKLGFFTSDPRSVLLFEKIHIPKRLKRTYRQRPFEMTMDRDFQGVIQGCRKDRPEWISKELMEVYLELHRLGVSRSFEAWDDGELVGGVMGTQVGAVFMAESMFRTRDHASNLCVVFMLDILEACEFDGCDIQYSNDHTKIFNPVEMSGKEFSVFFEKARGRWPKLKVPCSMK
jgi:leucyl/phenylalanyl-tRNA---protein transferase